MASRLSTREHYADLLDKYDTWLFDCDGVLWQGDTLIEGATEVLQLLRHHSASFPQFSAGLAWPSPLRSLG